MASLESLNAADARLCLPGGKSSEAFPVWRSAQVAQRNLSSQEQAIVSHRCEFCSKIIAKVSFEQGPPEPDPTLNRREDFIYDLQKDCGEAFEAATLGCQLLQYLLSAGDWDSSSPVYLEQSIHDTADQAFPKTYLRGLPESQRPRPWLSTEHDEFLDWYESETPWFSLVAPKDSVASKFVRTSDLVTPFWDKSVIECTRDLMNVCLRDHTSCRQNTSSRSPSRLLEIFHDSENTTCVRLVDAGNPCAPFFALSYCWGRDQPLKTRKSNIESLQRGLALGRLPCTIRDAIMVTQSMGITHIWIDAFCIVQDDEDDKIRELALMPDIYSGALVTIIAADSDACDKGFLNTSPAAPMFHLTVETDNGDQGSLFLEPVRLMPPIDTRAWTYQEGLLSPRVLYFNSRLSIWGCAEKTIGSSGRTGRQSDDGILAERQFIRSRHNERRIWWNSVGTYSRRKLTFKADKPNAFAGIAEQFARGFCNKRRMPGEYLAGHWSSDLSISLGWGVEGIPRRPKSAELQAPSWSWMSIDGEINNVVCAQSLTQSSVQILEAQTILKHPSLPYGPVRSGYITLVGKLERVAYEVTHPTDGIIHLIDCDQHIGVAELDFAVDITELPEPFGDQVWLLDTNTSKELDGGEFHRGIILAKVSLTTKYRRVGYWSAGSRQKRRDTGHPWIGLQPGVLRPLPSFEHMRSYLPRTTAIYMGLASRDSFVLHWLRGKECWKRRGPIILLRRFEQTKMGFSKITHASCF